MEGDEMPKDPTRNIARYKVRGGHINEYDFVRRHNEMTHEEEPQFGYHPDIPIPSEQARNERIKKLLAKHGQLQPQAEQVRNKSNKAFKAKPAKKAAGKTTKQASAPKKATSKTAKQASAVKKATGKTAKQASAPKKATSKTIKRASAAKKARSSKKSSK
jgi:hypothetical protein